MGCRSSSLESLWFFLVELRGDLNPGIFVASWKVRPLTFSIPHLSLVMGRSHWGEIHRVRSGYPWLPHLSLKDRVPR